MKKEMIIEKLTIASGGRNARMVLEVDPDTGSPRILFIDNQARIRLQIGIEQDGFPYLVMKFANGSDGISLQAADDGTIASVLNYHNGNPALEIVISPQDELTIVRYENDGRKSG